MTITYDEAVADYISYAENKKQENQYTLDLSKPLTPPSAIRSADMLDPRVTFAEKAEFVEELLKGNRLIVKRGDTVICDVLLTEGVTFDTLPAFRQTPSALRFVVTAVFGKFLKNSLPPLENGTQTMNIPMAETKAD